MADKTYFELVKENEELKRQNHLLKQQNAELQIKTKDFDIHEIVDSQIARSKIPRLNWKNVLGNTLTKEVAGYYAQGYTADQTYQAIIIKLKSMQVDHPEIFRRLKIGVCARFGEIESERKKISEVRSDARLQKNV